MESTVIRENLRIFKDKNLDYIPHEKKQLDEIFYLVFNEIKNSKDFVYILHNFKIGGYEIDCVLLTEKGAVFLELKAIGNKINNPDNGDWEIINEDNSKEVIDNFFNILKKKRSRFNKRMLDYDYRLNWNIGPKQIQYTAAFFYFNKGGFLSNNIVEATDWFGCVTFDDFVLKCLKQKRDSYHLDSKAMDQIVKELNLTEYTSEEYEEILKLKIEDFIGLSKPSEILEEQKSNNNSSSEENRLVNRDKTEIKIPIGPDNPIGTDNKIDEKLIDTKLSELIVLLIEKINAITDRTAPPSIDRNDLDEIKFDLCTHRGNDFLKDVPPNFKKALEEFEKAFKIKGADSENLYNLGFCLDNLGDSSAADVCFDKALTLNPTDPILIEKLGNEFNEIKKYNKAMLCFIQLKNKDDEFWGDLGEFYLENDQGRCALECFERAIDICPDSDEYYYQKIHALIISKKYDLALECVYDVIEQFEPEDPEFIDMHGDILFNLERFDEAFDLYIQIHDPIDDSGWWHGTIEEDLRNNENQDYEFIADEWVDKLNEYIQAREEEEEEKNLTESDNEVDDISEYVSEFKGQNIVNLSDGVTKISFGIKKANLILENYEIIEKFVETMTDSSIKDDNISEYISEFKGHEILNLSDGVTTISFGIKKANLILENLDIIEKFVEKYE